MPALFHVSSYTWAYIHSLILFLDFRNTTQFRFKFASVINIHCNFFSKHSHTVFTNQNFINQINVHY